MDKKIPAVSFLIATYNRANFLVDCIESILSQTCKDFEIIIVDDGSTDSTEDIIKERYDGRVIYHRNNVNRGVAAARNTALRYASGKYIGLLDSDDILYTTKFLEIALEIIESKNVDVFCCDNYRIDSMNRRISDKTFFQSTIDHRDIRLSSGVKDFDYIFFHGIHSCGAIVRRSIIDEIGFLNEDFKIAWDEDFFLRVALNPKYVIYYYNEPLTGYRMHSGNISKRFSPLYKEKIACRLQIINKNKHIKVKLGQRINKRFASQYLCLADAYKREKNIPHCIFNVLKMISAYPFFIFDIIKSKAFKNFYEGNAD